MDARCSTCKHWTYRIYLAEPYRECERIPSIYSMDVPTDIASVTTDCAAVLITMPTFGCVEWIHKDSPE